MPGSTPATSQLDWLSSTTAMIVLSWSKATRDLLKSFGWGIRALHQLDAATMVPSPRRLPGLRALSEAVPAKRQGTAIAVFTASFTVGSSLSFALSGLLASAFGWRLGVGLLGLGAPP